MDSLRHIHALSFLPTGKQLGDTWQQLLLDNGGKQHTLNVTDELGRYTLLSLGRAAFGFAFDEAEVSYLADTILSNVLQPVRFIPGSLYDLLPVQANRTAKDLLQRLNNMIYTVMAHRRAFHAARAIRRAEHDAHVSRGDTTHPTVLQFEADESAFHPILMDRLLHGMDAETGQKLADVDVRDQTLAFVLAGLESSQLSLSTALWLLAHNPVAQQRCYAELVRVCGEHIVFDAYWSGPTFDDIKKMPYMQAVLWESVRLFRLTQPVRQCNAPTQVGDVPCPAGTVVIVDAWSLHRNTKYWGPNADRFCPERWLSDDEVEVVEHAEQQKQRDAHHHTVHANGHANDHANGHANGNGEHKDKPHNNSKGASEPRCRSSAAALQPQLQAFFAFGGSGPRACPGKSFALGWQRTALCFLLSRFVFSPKESPQTQVLADGKSTDLKFATKGLFNVPFVELNVTPRPGFGQAPSPHSHARTVSAAAAASASIVTTDADTTTSTDDDAGSSPASVMRSLAARRSSRV